MGPWVRHASALERLLKGALRAPRVNTDLWGPDGAANYPLAHSEGGSRFSASELIVVGQGAHARRRPALRQARPVHSLLRDRSASMDEGPPASVHEPAVVGETLWLVDVPEGEHQLIQVFALEHGIMVHTNTSVYMMNNEVEPRLGRIIHLHALLYTMGVFLNYAKIHH
jgi:hypothetical protein